MNFKQKLDAIISKNDSLLCLGLDPDLNKIPKHLTQNKDAIFDFNKAIIDATHDLVCVYKPNIAFYEAYGIKGLEQLKQTIEYIKKNHPEIPIVLDAKRGDIGNTAKMYAKSVFEYWDADAVTVYPHLGLDSLTPFFEYKDKLVILLLKTSNPDSGMFQDLLVYSSSERSKSRSNSSRQARTIPYYLALAEKIKEWNFANIGIFVGATYPKKLKELRSIFPEKIFLSAGFGTQAGAIEEAVKAGIDKNKSGIMFNASRSILYKSSGEDFAQKAREEAKQTRNSINTFR